jgi:hypothetical protein
MKVPKLNIYAAIAVFSLAIVAGQETLAGNKTVISGGGIAVENSSNGKKAVIAGGATLVINTRVVETPSAMPSMYPSVSPSVSPTAVPTPVIGLNIVPAPSPKEVPAENSAAPRPSSMVGMLLLSLLTGVIFL